MPTKNEFKCSKSMQKLLRALYIKVIRKLFPTTSFQTYAGIKFKPVITLDKYLPTYITGIKNMHNPEYESALVDGLKKHICTEDRVIIIGGGKGVTACIASIKTSTNGNVICYEASIEGCGKIMKTISYNEVPENINVINSCVGEPISIWGKLSPSEVISPKTLPKCDILELDCEGAEKKILSEMTIRPRVILVETHGLFDSPTHEVRKILEKINYKIENIDVAEKKSSDYCIENDIKVITALYINR